MPTCKTPWFVITFGLLVNMWSISILVLEPIFAVFKLVSIKKNPDWFSCLGYRKTPAIYHVKCHGRFLSSFWRNHGYSLWKIYLGKVRSHTPRQFPAVKGSRVTARNLWLINKMREKLVQFMLNMFRQVLVMTLKHHKKVVVVSQQSYIHFLGSQSGQKKINKCVINLMPRKFVPRVATL